MGIVVRVELNYDVLKAEIAERHFKIKPDMRGIHRNKYTHNTTTAVIQTERKVLWCQKIFNCYTAGVMWSHEQYERTVAPPGVHTHVLTATVMHLAFINICREHINTQFNTVLWNIHQIQYSTALIHLECTNTTAVGLPSDIMSK